MQLEDIKDSELRQIAEQHLKYLKSKVKERTFVNLKQILLEYFKFIGTKKIMDAKLAREYIASLEGKSIVTKREYCSKLKSMLEELKLIDDEAKKILKIRVRRKDTLRVKSASDILSKDEIKKMINAARNARDQALIAMLFDSGARIGELLNLRIRDITFHEQYFEINISKSKSQERSVVLVESLPYIMNWLRIHPYKDDPNAFVFINFNTKKRDKHLTNVSVWQMLRRTARDAGIKKRIYAHLFRHTRITYFKQLDLSDSKIKLIVGLDKNSNALGVYDHIINKDAKDAMLKLYGLQKEKKKEIEALDRVECPRCGTKNMPGSVYCSKCGFLLDVRYAEKLKKAEELETKILQLILEDKELKEIIKQKLKEINALPVQMR